MTKGQKLIYGNNDKAHSIKCTYTGEYRITKDGSVIYEYASDDGRILSEEITYCDDFNEQYEDFVRRTQMFNPDGG